ncbi:MAG: peptidoglycan DD-metalloendopeptidase family protein [Treponema sp.]|nr:peptidoglycan DD-metalloendopeptidase family protein [Treponema sp.]
MVYFLNPGGITGQTQPDVLGFNREVFTYHFDRADRELTPEQWLAEARRGISLARLSWERQAAELYGDPGAVGAAEGRIEKWSESELESRFAEWLIKRYFGGAVNTLAQGVAAEIGETNRQYLFYTDGTGQVLYDPDTGDPLVIRPGDEGRDFVIDREKWRRQVEDAINAGVGAYKNKIAEFYPELLSYIPGDRRANFETKLEETASAASLKIRQEFEGLAAREERLFITRRMGDVFSLRRKSDDEAAFMISARLVTEAETVCSEGLSALQERIEAAEGGSGDLVLAGNEWLEAYREQFERGLKAWADAEERFFIRRIEWEQEAGKQYADGEEAWSTAFTQFEQNRQIWENKAKALFESGEKLFQRASENLERAIAEAKAEFDTDLKLRTAAGAERARAWVDMYITSASVVSGAQENIDFLLKNCGAGETLLLGSEELMQWLNSRQKTDWLQIQAEYEIQSGGKDALWHEIEKIAAGESDSDSQAAAIEKIKELDLYFGSSLEITDEIRRWSELYQTYMLKAREARDALVNDFGLVIGTGALKDILAPGVASEDFNLDEYQVELIRAKAVAGYWAKRVSIAGAVLAYAEEISAGRMTDGEGVKAWEAAKQAYDDAVRRYEEEQKKLNAEGARVLEAREALYKAAEELREANGKLEELNQAYAILMAAYSAKRSDFILEELAVKYKELLQGQDLLNAAGTEGAYARYLERAGELGFAQELEGAGELLQRLVTGNNGGEKSLAELREGASKIFVFAGNENLPDTIEAYGLDPEDPYYGIIRDLLAERNLRTGETDIAEEKNAINQQYRKLIVAVTGAAKKRAEGLIEDRLQGIKMLAGTSAGDWYFSALAYEPAPAEQEALDQLGLEQRLKEDADRARRVLLQARAGLELEGLNYILSGGGVSEAGIFLSFFYAAAPEKIAAHAEALQYLRKTIEENFDKSGQIYLDKLEEAAGKYEILQWFIQGGSFFNKAGNGKITEALLPAYAALKDRAEGLLELYQNFGRQTPLAAREQWAGSFNKLRRIFSSYGIEAGENYLPGIALMGKALANRPGNPAENLAGFLYQLDGELKTLPDWISGEFETWKKSFIEYMAARMIYVQTGPGKTSGDLQEKGKILKAQILALQEINDTLNMSAPGDARALCAALNINAGGFSLLNRANLEDEAARRIGSELAGLYGAADIQDEAGLREALKEGAARYFDFAGETVRQKAVEEALGIFRVKAALNAGENADLLEGETKRLRLYQLFFSMGLGGEGQDTALSRITELAGTFAALSEEERAPLAAFTASYVLELRDAYGEAGLIAERMLGAALALVLDDPASFKRLREELGLNLSDTPESLYELARTDGFSIPADILKFKGSLAGEAMLFRLKYLSSGGGWETCQQELDSYKAYIAGAYAGDPAGLIRQERYLQEAEAYMALLKMGRTYLGSGVSGDNVFEWVLQKQKTGRLAGVNPLDLFHLASSGTWEDPFNNILTQAQAAKDVYHELLSYELNNYYDRLLEAEIRLNYEYALAEAYEKTGAALQAEEKDHWRQYITEDFLREYNEEKGEGEKLPAGITGAPEGDYKISRGALGPQEGVLADALEKAERNREILNAAFGLCDGNINFDGMDEFRAEAQSYLNNPGRNWDDSAVIAVSYRYYNNYYLEAEELQKHIANEEYLRREIGRLGRGYNTAQKGEEELLAEREEKLREIAQQQEVYKELAEKYSQAAYAFMGAGENYDALYKETKNRYEILEKTRFSYETQDAIRRWASTAYLDKDGAADPAAEPYRNPHNELVYARERMERADIALAAIAGLYNSGETRRPYADPAYEELYKKYEESFSRMILSLRAMDSLDAAVRREMQKNDAYYQTYQFYLSGWGNPPEIPGGYSSPQERSEWEIRDLIYVKDGKLAFAADDSFYLNGKTAETAAALEDYFNRDKTLAQETNKVSLFEEAQRGLIERIAGYALDSEKYQQWGLARDYLVRQLFSANPEAGFLETLYETAKALDGDQNLGKMPIVIQNVGLSSFSIPVSDFAEIYQEMMEAIQFQAWEALSGQEKADLEFYIIITLLGGGGENSDGFSKISSLGMFQSLWQYADANYRALDRASKTIFIGWMYRSDRDTIKATRDRLKASLDGLTARVSGGLTGLKASVENLRDAYKKYKDSCDYVAALKGSREGIVQWDDLLQALKTAGDLKGEELEKLETYWDLMNQETGETYGNNIDALQGLIRWAKTAKEDIKRDFEEKWEEDELKRLEKEAEYRETAESYVAGRASLEDLKTAAEAAFGAETPAGKNHLENLERVIMKDLNGVMEDGSGYNAEYIGLAEEYVGLIRRVYTMRYNAELAAREAEWDQHRRDIQEKHGAWQKTAALILERGREDWQSGTVKLKDARNQWLKDYQKEYLRISNLWAAAYLAGLEDKEAWIAQAAAAANNASSVAALALVGADAETMARAMDTRIPMDTAGLGSPEDADRVMQELLNAAGIVNLTGAFTAITGSAETLPGVLARGIGGPNVWNAGMLQVSAAAFARETNKILAEREAKSLAINVKKIIQDAIKNLSGSIDEANQGFRKSMDDLFIIEGQWKRSGKNYIKDVIVHSTLIDPVITEQVSVEGYQDYQMEPVNLKTELDENRLKTLEALEVQALIDDMMRELGVISDELFGTKEENSKEGAKARTITIEEYKEKIRFLYQTVVITDEYGNKKEERLPVPEKYQELVKSEERVLGAGKFGLYIGYQPVVKTGIDPDQGKNDIFVDQGRGQLGKLMADYIYWTIREGQGVQAMTLPGWEKPFWDSRNSSFKAPSIRSAVDLGSKIASAALIAAAPVTGGASVLGSMALTAAASASVSLADDLFFTALDISSGYKDFYEAGFEFGKKALVTAASFLVSAAFSGIGIPGQGSFGAAAGAGTTGAASLAGGGLNGMVNSGLGGASAVIAKTAMTGVQSLTTGTITSGINAITYDRENGFGWSGDIFAQGVRGSLSGALVNMTGVFAQDMTGQINLFDGEQNALIGNIFNRVGIERFNKIIGGLAEQGVSYALGEDFTINLLNVADFSGGRVNSGLLELGFGRNGISMGLGSGGADLSMGSLLAGAAGLYDTLKIGGAKAASLFGNDTEIFTLNAINMLGYTGNELNLLIGQGIWQETIKARYENLGSDSEGNEILGLYDRESPNTISLSEALLGKGNAKGAALASVMAHEGTHLQGNRYEYLANLQGLETYTDLITMFNAGGDGRFLTAILGALNDPVSYTANTGSTDYWKVMRDGTLVYDGQGYLKDENGFYISKDGNRTKHIVPGETIGAGGIETGLLNILYGGTSGKLYDGFSDWKIEDAQELLLSSGFVHNGAEKIRDRMWNTGNEDKSISFDKLKDFGNTIAVQVFMNGMDELSDKVVFGNAVERLYAHDSMPDYIWQRFDQLVSAKRYFYDAGGTLFQNTEGLSVSQLFTQNNFYAGDQHRGVDVRGASGTSIQSGYSGKVIRNYNSQSAGNSVIVEYGFNFENSFYTTGIQSQFMHLKNPSALAENTIIKAATIIGLMGNTGLVDPAPTKQNPNAGTHLHYQLMGNLPGYEAASPAWDMLDKRRNKFLSSIGAPPTSDYVSNHGTSLNNNYTGKGYNNYFYNANRLFLQMGF